MTDGGSNVDVRVTADPGHDLETKPPSLWSSGGLWV